MLTADLIQKEIERLVEERLQRILANPEVVIEHYHRLTQQHKAQLTQQQPMVEGYLRLMDASGLVSCAKAADIVGIVYLDPAGKQQRMGANHFIGVLAHDGIIYKEAGGYRLSARFKEYGTTKLTEKNGMMKSSVLFTSKGVDYLKRRYDHDTRQWRSIHGKLHVTMGLPAISGEGQDPHGQVENPDYRNSGGALPGPGTAANG